MNEALLLYGFFVGIMVVALACMVLSGLQLLALRRNQETKRAMRRLRGNNQPTVTVLVYVRNQQAHVVKTLAALRRNHYHAFDVVVVDDASSDASARVARGFAVQYPAMALHVLRRRQFTTTQAALQAGYRKSRRGSIVLVVTPNLMIDPAFIKRTVAARRNTPTWRAGASEKGLSSELTLGDIGHVLERNYWQLRDSGKAYAARSFLRKRPGISHLVNYQGGIRAFVGVLLIAIGAAGAWLAFGVTIFWYLWVVVTAYGLAAIWLRYGVSLRDRLILTLSVPLALFLVPVAGSMREISQRFARK